ncbi:hypothetical protein ZOSMA_82G00480 [Zostera marina]|uniref:Uncharacterized protein n=1 Tax=Zostera marina TaxID=29655 RepID=A0A0K9NMA3_ZOSMR|nr:hypothetical protein ZOSMA_82G00480 [Zostera marina]
MASKFESCELPRLAELFYAETTSKLPEDKSKKTHKDGSIFSVHSFSSENEKIDCNVTKLQFEHCEEMLIKLNEMKRYRRIVGSVGMSCLKAATPLLVSKKESACLIALEIVEGGTTALAKVEEAYKCEKKTKEAINETLRLYFFQEGDDIADDGDENRLLPAINKIWPYLILCIKNKTSVV